MTVAPRVQLRVDACGAHSVLTTLHQPQPAASGSHSLSTLLEGGPCSAAVEAAVRADLEQRSYTLLRADEPSRLRVLRRAEDALVAFFALPEADKEACAGRSELGGACGFNRWPQRQQWHGRSVDARRREPWSASAKVEDALQEATDLLEEVAMRCLGALAAGSGSIAQLHTVCADARARRADHSVTDGFLYAAPARQPTEPTGAGAGNRGAGGCGSAVGAGNPVPKPNLTLTLTLTLTRTVTVTVTLTRTLSRLRRRRGRARGRHGAHGRAHRPRGAHAQAWLGLGLGLRLGFGFGFGFGSGLGLGLA